MTDETVKGEVIEDARTGEIIPRGANQLDTSKQETRIDIHKVGTLELSPQEEEILAVPLDPKDVRIRPDGLVYLPWTYYANILNKAFGRLKWGLLPQGSPQVKQIGDYGDMLVIWGHWFVIKGVPISFSYGETTFRPSNATMSEGDASEGAKSISLARNCKQLGIALELWDADWVAWWKSEYAETYKGSNNRTLWRRKVTGTPRPATQRPQNSTQGQNPTQTTPKAAEGVSEGVSTAQELAESYTPQQLRVAERVDQIKADSESPDVPTVMKFLASLDKEQTYTIGQVVKMIREQRGTVQ
jgi:hypothetical protein